MSTSADHVIILSCCKAGGNKTRISDCRAYRIRELYRVRNKNRCGFSLTETLTKRKAGIQIAVAIDSLHVENTMGSIIGNRQRGRA